MATRLPSTNSIREALFDVAIAVTRIRFEVELIGAGRIPAEGPALLVANRQLGLSEPAVVALGVHDATGRRVRVVALPDLPIIGDVARRLAAAIDQPLDSLSLLADGQLALTGLGRRPLNGPSRASGAGSISAGTTASALDLGVPVLPIAVVGSEFGRRWRVVVGQPIEPPPLRTRDRARRFADDTRIAVQRLLTPEVGI
jgi:1-acyl-sn-glycerol-3-phosphate acyltransferase